MCWEFKIDHRATLAVVLGYMEFVHTDICWTVQYFLSKYDVRARGLWRNRVSRRHTGGG